MINRNAINGGIRIGMDAQTHWDNIYGKKAADAVS
jgi:hypothetical protein